MLQELKDKIWKKEIDHRCKIAVIAMGYLILIAAWNHSISWIMFLSLAIVSTLAWFPEAEDKHAWLTVAARGEKFWFINAEDTQRTTLLGIGGLLSLWLLYAVWQQRFWTSIFLVVVLSLAKAVFLMFAHNIAEHFRPPQHVDVDEIFAEDDI